MLWLAVLLFGLLHRRDCDSVPRRYLASTWGLYKALACCARCVYRATAGKRAASQVLASVLLCASHDFYWACALAHTIAYQQRSSALNPLLAAADERCTKTAAVVRTTGSTSKSASTAQLRETPPTQDNHVRRARRLRRDGAPAAATTGQRRRRVVAARGPVLPVLF